MVSIKSTILQQKSQVTPGGIRVSLVAKKAPVPQVLSKKVEDTKREGRDMSRRRDAFIKDAMNPAQTKKANSVMEQHKPAKFEEQFSPMGLVSALEEVQLDLEQPLQPNKSLTVSPTKYPSRIKSPVRPLDQSLAGFDQISQIDQDNDEGYLKQEPTDYFNTINSIDLPDQPVSLSKQLFSIGTFDREAIASLRTSLHHNLITPSKNPRQGVSQSGTSSFRDKRISYKREKSAQRNQEQQEWLARQQQNVEIIEIQQEEYKLDRHASNSLHASFTGVNNHQPSALKFDKFQPEQSKFMMTTPIKSSKESVSTYLRNQSNYTVKRPTHSNLSSTRDPRSMTDKKKQPIPLPQTPLKRQEQREVQELTSAVKEIFMRQDLRIQDDVQPTTLREKLEHDMLFIISQDQSGILAINLVKFTSTGETVRTFEINTGRKGEYIASIRDPQQSESVLLVERRYQGGRPSLLFNRIDIREPQLIVSPGIKDFILNDEKNGLKVVSGRIDERPCLIVSDRGSLWSYQFEEDSWREMGVVIDHGGKISIMGSKIYNVTGEHVEIVKGLKDKTIISVHSMLQELFQHKL